MKIYSAQFKGTTTVATGSNVSLTGSFSGSIAGIDINATNQFTASTSTRLTNIEIISASNINRITSLETKSASVDISISNINAVTASNIARLSNLETKSSSVDISVTNINSFTASNGNTSLNQLTGSLATTGSNSFFGTQVFSGSVFIANDLVVQGSSSIQYISASSVSIGTNIVQLNTATPSVRFAGLSVQDSGSSAGVTGSMLWDSLCNRWIYSNPSTIGYSGGMLMSGPRASTLGSETPLTCNYIAKSGGGDHLYDSCIQDVSGSVSIFGTLCTSGIICSSKLEIKQSSDNRLVIDCVNTANEPRISSLDSSNNPQYLTINSYDLKIKTNCGEALRINDTKQFIVGATSMAYANSIGYVAGFMSDFTGQSVVSIARKGQTLASQGMYIGIDSTTSYFWNRDNVAIQLGTNDTTKMTIACTGQVTFACSVCAPYYVSSNASNISYQDGQYIVSNSESEVCVLGPATSAYVPMKYWIADRTGTIRVKFSAYIVSGPNYWAYQFRKNASSVLATGHYNSTLEPGQTSNVHAYTTFTNTLSGLNPGDCITYEMASANSGGTATNGSGTQCLFVKELRFLSNSPSISNNYTNNVFGQWVGIGTSCPFSNLEIRNNNEAAYDASVDSGQDGCGVTMTIRNGSTVTNSFAQLNLQVSGDSGRAVGRIALIRRDSATADMAFVTECGNTKNEVMRLVSDGKVAIGTNTANGYVLRLSSNSNNNASCAAKLMQIGNDVVNALSGFIYIGSYAGIDWLVGKDTSGQGDYRFNLSLYTGEQRMTVYTNGNYSFAGSNVSDLRLKSNINNLCVNAIDKINQLTPKCYNMDGVMRYGFVAQDVKPILSDLITGEEKEKEYLGLDYNGVLTVAVKAIQEQQCIICSQASMISTLKSCIGIV